jgi:hypothetical protein
MVRTIKGVASLALVVVLASCSQSHERDLCDEGSPCEMEGLLRCSADNDSVETCLLNDSSCLVWTVTESCDHGACSTDTGSPECGCDDECDDLNESRCDGDVVMQCMRDDSGCLYWDRIED